MCRKKMVVVSGAASGIGAAICCELLKTNIIPVGIDVKPFSISELRKKTLGLWCCGKDFLFYRADASNRRAMKAVFSNLLFVDGLVNNAGLLGGDKAHGGRKISSFKKMMKAHVQTALVLTELSYPLMREGGSIVNIGSLELTMAAPEVVLYTIAKGALWGMTIAYSTTLAERGIRVNMVSPGNVNTERNKAQYESEEGRRLIDRFEARTPLRRSVEPEEVASTVLFLLLDKSSAITGEQIVVDCGYRRALWDPGWTSRDLKEVYKK
ncbi:MAG: SDR family oxidoreductase [bacterium]|nr:SDR family oxidoreductase [bacterium]